MKTRALRFTFSVFTLVILLSTAGSCADDNLTETSLYTTRFCVYECNDKYTENTTTTSFVSIGAEISIWELTGTASNPSYRLIDVIETGEDGKATYKHSNPTLYYSVEKLDKKNKLMSNLLSPLSDSKILRNKFQVAGIFSSNSDAEKYSSYNLPHLSEPYLPKAGSIRFKDINGDDVIDLDDSVTKAVLHSTYKSVTEEIVYIAVDTSYN